MTPRSYTTTRRTESARETTQRILDAAAQLVVAGTFHEATMEEIAASAGVSRATVFGRFGSKLGVLEALSVRCAGGPEMQAIRAAFAHPEPLQALDAVVAAAAHLWETQGAILQTLKAISILEPQATRLIDEQREDQRTSIVALVRRLARAGRLREGMGERRAAAALHMLTSLESFTELRREYGLSERATIQTLTDLARSAVTG